MELPRACGVLSRTPVVSNVGAHTLTRETHAYHLGRVFCPQRLRPHLWLLGGGEWGLAHSGQRRLRWGSRPLFPAHLSAPQRHMEPLGCCLWSGQRLLHRPNCAHGDTAWGLLQWNLGKEPCGPVLQIQASQGCHHGLDSLLRGADQVEVRTTGLGLAFSLLCGPG